MSCTVFWVTAIRFDFLICNLYIYSYAFWTSPCGKKCRGLSKGGLWQINPWQRGSRRTPFAITPNTCRVSRSPRLAVGAVGAGGAQAEALGPGEHRPPVVGARRAAARVKPARVFPQGPPQVAALGHSARHVPHQVHDGRHLAESCPVSSTQTLQGPSRG